MAELPSPMVRHYSHPHWLLPLPVPMGTDPFPSLCRICSTACSSAPALGCQRCYFFVHEYCLEKLPLRARHDDDDEDNMAYDFWSTMGMYNCSCCRRDFANLGFYSNDRHRLPLCLSCAVVLSELSPAGPPVSPAIDHFLHPCPMVLQFSPFSTCNACGQNHHEITYRCKWGCGFDLDLGCHQAPAVRDKDQILHFCHYHPLELRTDAKAHRFVLCHICEKPCSDESFNSCIECGFYIHKVCMDMLPQKTRDHLPDEFLTLLPLPSFECTTCNRSCLSRLAFQSSRVTKPKFCIRCILWPGGMFKSIHHQHPLTDGETDEAEDIRCFMCGEYCSGWTYHCNDCSIFIHKSCAELPRHLELPYYPKDLTLVEKPLGGVNCFVCRKNLSQDSFAYGGPYYWTDKNEKFYLDSFCVRRRPSLQYQGDNHLHLHTIVENMPGDASCGVCSRSCRGFTTLRCMKCEFGIHLFCGPLPCIINHPRHVHPLALEEYYVEDNESDEFACHNYEQHRDPRLRVYRCWQGCMMICDVECSISEVLPLLRGEGDDVELRTPYPQVASKVISKKLALQEMMIDCGETATAKSLNARDAFSLRELSDSIFGSMENQEEVELDIELVETRSSCETSYTYSWEEFARFVGQFRTPSNLENDFLQKHEGSVVMGSYQLPITISPIYEEFFGKYKIIGDQCKLSYEQERSYVFIFCCVLHEMRMTKVVDATKEEILKWLGWIRYVEEQGAFNLGFLIDGFRQHWEAHFLIESKRIVDEKSSNLEQGIEESSKLIEELKTKLEATEVRLRELKSEKQAHNVYRRVGAYVQRKVYKNALEIKWRSCYDSAIRNAPGTSSGV